MKVILDASVLIEGLDHASPSAPKAIELRQSLAKQDLQAPALVVWETGNFVARWVTKSTTETAEDGSIALAGLTRFMAMEIPSIEAAARIIRLTQDHGLTFYDANYLELAQRDPSAILISNDGRLRDAAYKTLGKERVYDLAAAYERFVGKPFH